MKILHIFVTDRDILKIGKILNSVYYEEQAEELFVCQCLRVKDLTCCPSRTLRGLKNLRCFRNDGIFAFATGKLLTIATFNKNYSVTPQLTLWLKLS